MFIKFITKKILSFNEIDDGRYIIILKIFTKNRYKKIIKEIDNKNYIER